MALTKEQSAVLEKNNLNLTPEEEEQLDFVVNKNELSEDILDEIGGGKIRCSPKLIKGIALLAGGTALSIIGAIGTKKGIDAYRKHKNPVPSVEKSSEPLPTSTLEGDVKPSPIPRGLSKEETEIWYLNHKSRSSGR